MNWEILGIIAEIVGAAAVVVTLIFLTKETRLNRLAAESNSVDALAAGWNELNTNLLNDPELCELWVKAFANPEALSELEQLRFMLLGQCYVNHFSTAKKHYDAGTLPKKDWDAHKNGSGQIMNTPGGLWLLNNIVVTADVKHALVDFERDEKVKPHMWAAGNAEQ